MIGVMDTRPLDPEALKRRGIIQRLLGGMNLRFPGVFALLATVTLLDILIPDIIPFIDEIILALLTMLFALWKDRRLATVDVTKARGGPPLPPPQPTLPPLPPTPPAER
jgi:hypothetical protein